MARNKNMPNIILAAAVWLVAWVLTQGLFMSGILDRLPGELNTKYLLATGWVAIVLTISLFIFPTYRKASLPKSRLLWLYIIPAILLALLPRHYHMPLFLPIYMLVIVITVFWQDYLTFGILQSHLTTKVSTTFAAVLTAALFLLAHIIFFFQDIANPLFLLTALSAFIYSFFRKYIRNIYIANILHFCSYLV